MDEVIFEEFKGTGNMELCLDRNLVDKRIYPAMNVEKSGTRKEEILLHPDELNKIWTLRKAIKDIPAVEAMELIVNRLKKTKTNAEFLMSVHDGM
jgi:transcription termination factor Rho